MPPADQPTSRRVWRANGYRSGSDNHSSSTTDRAPPAISAPNSSCERFRTAIRSSRSARRTQSTRYSTTTSNFNFIRDIAPVASMMRTTNVMVVQPSFPAKSVPEFIAYAKENPGKINMADAGVGSPPHVYGELFKAMAGVDLIQVHYRGGGPALVDLLGGQVNAVLTSITSSIEYIRAGRLRALAITSATRSVALPDIPTMSEFVPGYEASGWFGLGAPK